MTHTHPKTERVVVWLLLSACRNDGTHGIALGDSDGYRCSVAAADHDSSDVAVWLASYIAGNNPDNPDTFLSWLDDTIGGDAGLATAYDVYYPRAYGSPGGTADIPPRDGLWLTLPTANGVCEVRTHGDPTKVVSIKRARLNIEWADAARAVAKASEQVQAEHRKRTRIDWERIYGADVARQAETGRIQ